MKKSFKIFSLVVICLFMIIPILSIKVIAMSPSAGGGITNETSPIVSNETQFKKALEDVSITEITLAQGFELTSTVKIERPVVINGEGKTIITASNVKKSFEIHNTTDEKINVTFNNITIINAYNQGRCIDTRNDKINLALNGVHLKTTSAGNNQPLTVGGSDTQGLSIEIKESTISAGTAGYAIITFVPANIKIEDSSITGYAALYVKSGSAGLKVDVINSTLEGKNNNTGEDDSFGTIVVDESNITINVSKNSIIRSNGKGAQTLIADRSTGTDGNKIDITSAKIEANGSIAYVKNSNTDLSFQAGVHSNVELPKEYLPTGVNNIKVITSANGTIKVDKTVAKEGQEVVVTATPNSGYIVRSISASWTTQAGSGYEETFTFIMPNEDVEITAVFEEVKQNVTIEAEVPSEIENADKIEKEIVEKLKDILSKGEESIIKNRNLVAELIIDEWDNTEEHEEINHFNEYFKDVIEQEELNLNSTKRFKQIFINVKDKDTEENLMPLELDLEQPLKSNASLSENLPKVADEYEREFYIIRRIEVEHSFIYDVLEADLSEDGKKLEFSTDKTGLFNIAYRDVKKELVTPPAGDEDNKENQGTVNPPIEDEKNDSTVTPPTIDGNSGTVKPEAEPKDETTTPDVPKTGDNLVVFAVIAIVAMVGIVETIKFRKK